MRWVWLARALLLFLGLNLPVAAAQQRHPLEPAHTTSPRETLDTFLSGMDQAWELVRDEGEGIRSREGLSRILSCTNQVRRTFDFSEVAPEARREIANDATTHLYEVLCRIELPPIEAVPGDDAVAADPELDRWSVPHTEITILRVADGERRGEFLFSLETLARLGEFYDRTKHLPYRRRPPVQNTATWRQVYGGWDVPIAWIDALPGWMRSVVWGQAWWKWVFVFLAALANLAVVFGTHRLTRRVADARSLRRYVARLAVPIVLLVSATTIGPFLAQEINLTGAAGNLVYLTATAVAHVSFAWACWLSALAVGEAVVTAPKIRTDSLDASLIRLTAQIIGLAVVVLLILRGASQIGLPLLGLVASLSIGGLAIALAAQDTLKALLGSLMIFTDQPYRVGERIVAGGNDGVVERIGLRSTRLRQLNGHLTSVPNEIMATMNIENIGRRESIRRKAQLRIATDTPPEKIEQALEIVREILANHEGMPSEQPPRVHFQEFNPDSLRIEFFYWFQPADYWEFSAFGERVNLEIVRRFATAGIELALPTSRTQLTSEAGGLVEVAAGIGTRFDGGPEAPSEEGGARQGPITVE